MNGYAYFKIHLPFVLIKGEFDYICLGRVKRTASSGLLRLRYHGRIAMTDELGNVLIKGIYFYKHMSSLDTTWRYFCYSRYRHRSWHRSKEAKHSRTSTRSLKRSFSADIISERLSPPREVSWRKSLLTLGLNGPPELAN